MTDLKDYAKQEDAALDAAWLGANGIEAVVVAESGYGGNLFGTTLPGTIRLQVLDDQVEAARELLNEKLCADTSEPTPEVSSRLSSASASLEETIFRAMVLIEFVLFMMCWLFPELFARQTPEHVQSYFLSIIPSQRLWENSFDLYGAICLVSFLASLLLYFFIRLGRVLFIVSLVAWTALTIFLPQQIINPLGSVIYAISNLLTGTILAQMYLGAVAVRFKETLPRPSGEP